MITDLLEEKRKKIVSLEDQQKIVVIEGLIKDPNWAFKLNAKTVMGILKYLDVPNDQIKSYYSKLISFENFANNYTKEYTLIDPEEENSMMR